MPTPVYTSREKTKRARLLFQGLHNAYGDTSRIEAQIERIDESAAERGRLQHEAHQNLLRQAKQDVAAKKVAERCATRGEEKQAARKTRQDAEKRLRAVERGGR